MITATKLAIVGVVSAATSILAGISDQVQMALIAAIAAAVTAIPAIVIALRGTNKKIDDKSDETTKKIDDLGVAVDGRLTKLLEEVSKAKYAEGMLAGLSKGAEVASKEKVIDALIAATPAAVTPANLAASNIPTAPIPVKIESPTPVHVVIEKK